MKTKNECYNRLFAATVISLFTTLVLFDLAVSYELVGWNYGPTGYELALKDAQEKESPVILFFYVDSNELCERLKNDYFGVYSVNEFLSDVPKVVINLDGGEFEKAIAAKYGVEQDPALFVIFPFMEIEPQGFTPFLENRDMTVDEFIKNIRDIFILAFSNRAFEFFEEQDYENALKYFQTARDFDPGWKYPYFALGTVYHAIAIEEKSIDSYNKAEDNYLKALEIDPDYKESKEELGKLRNDKDKIIVR